MELLSTAAGLLAPLIHGHLSGKAKIADAQEAAKRLLRIEVRTNLQILDAALPRDGKKLENKDAHVIIQHLSTSVAHAVLGAIDVPNEVINRLNLSTKNLVRKELKIAGWTQTRNSTLTLVDLLDFIVRKDAEMKALTAIEQATGTLKGPKQPSWLIRLRNFRKITFEVVSVLVPR